MSERITLTGPPEQAAAQLWAHIQEKTMLNGEKLPKFNSPEEAADVYLEHLTREEVDKATEYYLDDKTATPPPSREDSPDTPVVQLPTMLPHDYELLRDENGITEEKPPVSAPCFLAPDPSGTKPWLGIAVR